MILESRETRMMKVQNFPNKLLRCHWQGEWIQEKVFGKQIVFPCFKPAAFGSCRVTIRALTSVPEILTMLTRQWLQFLTSLIAIYTEGLAGTSRHVSVYIPLNPRVLLLTMPLRKVTLQIGNPICCPTEYLCSVNCLDCNFNRAYDPLTA